MMINLNKAASSFCDGVEHCSECPMNSNARDCLVKAFADSPMDANAVIQFLANYATGNPVVARAEGTVS